ncbi:hypothetical protein DL768_003318 [Monosporascus sp. mg162]|nr:hypothetical protein DL768_003318 [Monosporascus sp. mg162]
MRVTDHNPVEERKERKRLQNRLNQRAHSKIDCQVPPTCCLSSSLTAPLGQRIKDEADANPKTHKNPYHIERWRLVQPPRLSTQTSRPVVTSSGPPTNDPQVFEHENSQPLQSHAAKNRRIPGGALPGLELDLTHDSDPSLPADHVLINLIVHNVARGFLHNKNLLRLMASFVNAAHDPFLRPDLTAECQVAIVRPTHQILPHCLLPTQLQMSSPHPMWIDMLPFPEIRDNLIRRQHSFNHKDFLKALVGDLVYLTSPPEQMQVGPVSLPSLQRHRQQDGSLPEHDREGLILWGEPHLKENWEATPLFLIKWSWAVEGCRELVDISNRWRIIRGEDPLWIPTS